MANTSDEILLFGGLAPEGFPSGAPPSPIPGKVSLVFKSSDHGHARAGVAVTVRVRTAQTTLVLGESFDAFAPITRLTNSLGEVIFDLLASEDLPRESGALMRYAVACDDPYVRKDVVLPRAGGVVSQL